MRNRMFFKALFAAIIVVAATVNPVSASPQHDHGPLITWHPPLAFLSATHGSVLDTTLSFSVKGNVQTLTAQASPTLRKFLSADTSRIVSGRDGKFELPVKITAPTSADRFGAGEISLYSGRQRLSLPLPVLITFRKPSADAIPPEASPPSPDRVITDSAGIRYVKDELAVILKPEAPNPSSIIKTVARDTGGVIHGAVPATRTYQLRYPGISAAGLEGKRTAIQSRSNVDSVSLNLVSEPLAATPNDSKWDSWSLSSPDGNNWAMEKINAPAAWDITTGASGVRIGVIDTDLDRSHSDLNDNISRMDGRGSPGGGHGTHVSGTICAEGNNRNGVSGMMWDCDLRLFPYGSDAVSTQQAMMRAADDNARVVNMSLQFVDNNNCVPGRPPASLDTLLGGVRYANNVLGQGILHAQRTRRDVLWVFAAGNECRDAKYASPASLVNQFSENVITVASIAADGGRALSSNFGSLITVSAPGEKVFSTLPRTCLLFGLACSDNYGTMSGTSMASPHVAGLAGLVLSHSPTKTATQVKSCIVASARTSGAAVPGHNFRVVNAAEAVKCSGTISLPAKVDVVLSLDLTGSMGGVLNQAKTQVTQAITDLKAASPGTDFRFAVTSYEDYPMVVDSTACGSTYSARYGSGSDQPFRINHNLTSDAASISTAVNGLALGSGDDGPESYGRALWEVGQADTGRTLGFRPDALKLLVNFGDNVPHDRDINQDVKDPTLNGDNGIDPGRNNTVDCGSDDIDFQDGALAALTAGNIRLLHVDSSGGTTMEPYWRLWTSRTGGAYTSLNPSSGRSLSDVILDLLRLVPATAPR